MSRGKTIGLSVLAVLFAGGALAYMYRDSIGSSAITYLTRDLIGPRPAFQNDSQKVRTEWVEMRDGTRLFTRIYLPEGEGPWPTLLVRDAYQFQRYLTCHYYVRYGFACVHQDVRGQGESEGEWYPLRHEQSDGQDTLAWLTAQEFQNRNVALIGGSYLGLSQWAVASDLPDQVKTIVPTTSHGDFYEMVYRNGSFTQGVAGLWSAEIFYPLSEKQDAADKWMEEVVPLRPAVDAPRDQFKDAWTSYSDYIRHPDKTDAYWQQDYYQNLRTAHRSVDVPVLWIARWHDFFLEGTLEQFDELPTRDESLLLIQPGQHAGLTADLNYEAVGYTEFATTLAWLNHHLKGQPLPDKLRSNVIYYENGADRWQQASKWPRKAGSSVELQLADLDASANCGGALTPDLKIESLEPTRFAYDPADPVRTNGGAFMLNPNFAPSAVAEQSDTACQRKDILSFRSLPYGDGLHISGDISIELSVSSSAPDTSFTVKLSEVFADGRVCNIRDDITTLSSQGQAGANPALLKFDLMPIDWTLKPGSRLQLDVSSSNFPAFPAHTNTEGLWSEATESKIAEQTLYSGRLKLTITDKKQ
ncbi:MAG: hypothetical protein CMK09_04610 [Ponticaulis sp.]|nr:hypothetical protein [Ponticaulis sp.]|tara:strand:+ start:3331 stop:5088 length:1758 start_codon:yes stop_codon:yes gene_type:complete